MSYQQEEDRNVREGQSELRGHRRDEYIQIILIRITEDET